MGVRSPAAPLTALLTVVVLTAVLVAPAAAHAPEPHHITVQAGPYPVEVGFSEWPPLAERSLDITFTPEGGIEGKTATLTMVGLAGTDFQDSGPLGRHPRQRDRWGLDLIALPLAGTWTMELMVDGPEGAGAATVGPIEVGPRPGPPAIAAYLVGVLPLLAVIGLVVAGWRRVRPGQTTDGGSWA
ncbi:MAG: hypothetical protein H0U10_03095 [Chloroflexia bacterium]|nr:hypothetical protein [Chloroflexia bacterium]